MPFHTAQLALHGMSDEHVKEASWVVNSVAGSSVYFHGIDYNKETFLQELEAAVEHIKQSAQS